MFKGSKPEILMAINPFVFALIQMIIWIIVLSSMSTTFGKSKKAQEAVKD